jgi:hypothetical protein
MAIIDAYSEQNGLSFDEEMMLIETVWNPHEHPEVREAAERQLRLAGAAREVIQQACLEAGHDKIFNPDIV